MTITTAIASRILEEHPDETVLAAMRASLDEPEMVSNIVSSIVTIPLSCNSAPLSVAVAMARLEAIAEVDAEIACCLMAHLWMHASENSGEFDVCDAVDLWIANTHSPLVAKHLRFLAEMSPHPGSRKHFQSMLTK